MASSSDTRGGVTQTVYIGEFKAQCFEWINTLGVVMQLVVMSRLIKYAGLRTALVLVPVVSVAGYGAALAAPLVGVLLVARIAESTLDYSLSKNDATGLVARDVAGGQVRGQAGG
jgi:hypothetical protein